MNRARGRPRKYDPDTALEAAAAVFWEQGFSATSLTDLCEATGMNRPSLYAAFGDKRAIFLQTLGRFADRMSTALRGSITTEDLERALTTFYYRALDVYLLGDPHRGCMIVSTASVDATRDAEVRAILLQTIQQLDTALGERFHRAAEEGAIAADEADLRGRLATAVLHSLSVRARAGQSRRMLRAFARTSAALLVGATGS